MVQNIPAEDARTSAFRIRRPSGGVLSTRSGRARRTICYPLNPLRWMRLAMRPNAPRRHFPEGKPGRAGVRRRGGTSHRRVGRVAILPWWLR